MFLEEHLEYEIITFRYEDTATNQPHRAISDPLVHLRVKRLTSSPAHEVDHLQLRGCLKARSTRRNFSLGLLGLTLCFPELELELSDLGSPLKAFHTHFSRREEYSAGGGGG